MPDNKESKKVALKRGIINGLGGFFGLVLWFSLLSVLYFPWLLIVSAISFWYIALELEVDKNGKIYSNASDVTINILTKYIPIGLIAIFVGLLIWQSVTYMPIPFSDGKSLHNFSVCHKENIERITKYNDYNIRTSSIGIKTKEKVSKEGSDGVRRRCVKLFFPDEETENSILQRPVDKVVMRTFYIYDPAYAWFGEPDDDAEEQEEEDYDYDAEDESGGGAICRDGTRSYSTGRGTCSWHGGVDYWL